MVARSSTAKLRAETKSAIRAGFAHRGWRPTPGDPTRFVAPASLVESPLSVTWSLALDAYAHGGARFTGTALLRCDPVDDLIVTWPVETLPSDFSDFPGEENVRAGLSLDLQTAGRFVDPLADYHAWVVQTPEDVAPQVAELMALVDGPLTTWAHERRTVAQVLDLFVVDPADWRRHNAVSVRTVAVLALLSDRVDAARAVVDGYAFGMGDDPQRLAAFERELATRFPAYGPLQRQA